MILALMSLTVAAIMRIRNLYAVVMLGSIYSLLAASIFVVLDAVDVAFTEAAVGAGISTVLTLGTIGLTSSREKPSSHTRVLPIAVVLVTGAVLIYGTLDLAKYGDPNAPIHRHVAPTYIKEGPEKTGIPNIVTAVLASYRGYDTLGETTVIFTAGVGVILLMGNWRRRRNRRTDEFGDSDV